MKTEQMEKELAGIVTVLLVPGVGHVVGAMVEDGPIHFVLAHAGVLMLGDGQVAMGEVVPRAFYLNAAAASRINVPKDLVFYHGAAPPAIAQLWDRYRQQMGRVADQQAMVAALDPSGPVGGG